MEVLDRYDVSPARAWVATFVAAVVTIGVAALVFTRQVYYGVIWHYFWGPVHADAIGASCLVHLPETGETVTGAEAEGCSPAAYEVAYIAEPGYTVTSTFGYIVVLIFMLAGVYLLLREFDLTPYSHFFYALVPFMLFGGALRTVEDAFVAALRAGETPAIEFPASAFLISPFIYGTVFLIALAAFLASKYLAHRELTETYYYPLAGMGTAVLALTVGYLFYLSLVTEYASFYPSIILIVVGLATLLSWLSYRVVDAYWPSINEGTGLMGLVVIWGHAIDGVANVLANDWTWLWAGIGQYGAKHPLNRLIMDVTGTIQGGEVVGGIYVGDAWPFLIIKILVPIAILSLFDREFMEANPHYALMLLGAIVAVGLGPGTRDMLRVAFAI